MGFTFLCGRINIQTAVHPHVRGVYFGCGAHGSVIDWSIPTCVGFTRLPPLVRGQRPGPSPRAWGLRNDLIGFQERVRSIPTCVGFTGDTYDVDPRRPVHPHVRGVYFNSFTRPVHMDGPSPRAWGLLDIGLCPVVGGRSIPTCVGFTYLPNAKHAQFPVHPHVRGVY